MIKPHATFNVGRLIHEVGKPIIAPYLGCLPELLKNDGGILYDPYNKDGLLDAMELALTSKTKVIKMGKSNFEFVKKLDWKNIAESTGKVYVECLNK